LFGDGGIDAVVIGVVLEHIVVGERIEFLGGGDHEHLVLLVDPPVILAPFFVVGLHHFREELVLV
jgi:hypothetical protein